MLTSLLLLALASPPLERDWLPFDPPDARNWHPSDGNRASDRCRAITEFGEMTCAHAPQAFAKRWASTRGDFPYDFQMSVRPILCPLDQVEEAATADLVESMSRSISAAVEVERQAPNVLAAHLATIRMALVATPHDVIWVRLRAPAGLDAQDHADFDALVASARAIDGSLFRVRRARWLLYQSDWKEPDFTTCGLTSDQMTARAIADLRWVTEHDPDSWSAWALLGEEAEERGGGQEVLDAALALEPRSSARSWMDLDVKGETRSRPLDTTALREAAGYYAEAVRRQPPRTDHRNSRTPLERSTILSRLARAQLLLGDETAAEAAWREAVDEPARASWGYLESAFLLAELANARGELVEARRLYDLARRSYWTFHPSDLIQPPPGRALIHRIEQRRLALRNHCRVFGPILSTSRPGCARGVGY